MNWRVTLFVAVLVISLCMIGCGSSQPDQTAQTPPAAAPADQAAQPSGPQPSGAQPGQPAAAGGTHKAARRPESEGLRLPAERSTVAAGVTVPAGTALQARIDDTLSSGRNKAGDKFTATLVEPVVVNGRDVLPKGARLTGHVTTADSSGRLQGRAVIGVALDSIEYRGARLPITTTLDTRTSEAHKKRNIEMIGGGSALGAIIGGIAGGGKGAAIGAAAGAGAGTGTAYATGKKDVTIPSETILGFTLKTPVTLR